MLYVLNFKDILLFTKEQTKLKTLLLPKHKVHTFSGCYFCVFLSVSLLINYLRSKNNNKKMCAVDSEL